MPMSAWCEHPWHMQTISISLCFRLFVIPPNNTGPVLRMPRKRFPTCWEHLIRNRMFCGTIVDGKVGLGHVSPCVVVPDSAGVRTCIHVPILAEEVDVALVHVLDSLLAAAEPKQNGHGRQRTARVIAVQKNPSNELQWKNARCEHRCKMAG